MALPTPPGVSTNGAATAAAVAPQAAEEQVEDSDKTASTAAIKQFGPSEDADGNAIPVPTAGGVDCTVLVNEVYASLAGILAQKGITDVESWVEEAEAIDKTKFPGNKAGRVSYNVIRGIANIYKQYALWNKQRGVGGTGAMKKKLEEKENRIADLEKKLAELMAKLGG